MYLAALALGGSAPIWTAIQTLKVETIRESLLKEAYARVYKIYRQLGANDQVAKGPKFVERLKRDLASK
jgi:hypothetical protein